MPRRVEYVHCDLVHYVTEVVLPEGALVQATDLERLCDGCPDPVPYLELTCCRCGETLEGEVNWEGSTR